MQYRNVCILGGSGFVGRHISNQLAMAGYHIKILTRRYSHCQPLSVLPNTEIVETDIHNQQELDQHFSSIDVVINLVGILNEREHDGEGFRRAHVELSRKVLNACHHQNVPRLLHMSALNANASQGSSHYLRTKGEAENMVHSFAGSIKATSFRPSVIFGSDDSFFNRFASILKLSPLIFPLACANTRFAPVYVEDIANCFVSAINNPDTYDQRYDLCGPDIFTLKQLVQFTRNQLGLKCQIIALPDTLAQLQATILEYFPGKPFSIDNYHSLQKDSICPSPKSSICSCNHSPLAVMPRYLGKLSRHKQDDIYRQHARRDD